MLDALKKVLTTYLESKGIEVINRGTDSEESVDYPDHAHAVSEDVAGIGRLRHLDLWFGQRRCDDSQ